ncbi:DUF805 domain-containing protein [Acinetobacter guerrae]|uniref:DUF805 domain-containing protein n=1 Tax=Acinetobacter guerrae TaxID=1843371 RepID=UPI00125EAF51|nr:DUF805 domain-containing protein [Acinetobacter guerrae]
MKGKILDFSIQTNTGIISAEDGKRYNFAGNEWKEQAIPVRGNSVDFDLNEQGQATGVYLEIAPTPIPTPSKVNVSTQGNTLNLSPAAQDNLNKAKEAFSKWEQGEDNYRQAILTCFKKYVVFSGRARRSEFWYFQLFCFVAMIIFTYWGTKSELMDTLGIVFFFATLLPILSVTVRRLHDLGRSGWLILVALIPFIGIFIVLFWASQEGNPDHNQYGPLPKADLEA